MNVVQIKICENKGFLKIKKSLLYKKYKKGIVFFKTVWYNRIKREGKTMNIQNPVIFTENTGRTADPHITRVGDTYYHCYSTSEGVFLARTENLNQLSSAEAMCVYPAGELTHLYAPEMHKIGDSFYIYVSPDYGEDFHAMTVLKRESDDPFGEFENMGKVKGLEDQWTIDGTVLEHEGEYYFIYTECSQMYIAKMSAPDAIIGKGTKLCRPEYEFETKTEVLVNEGPAVLKSGERLFVIYSANDSKCDEYCLGVLEFLGGDILDSSNWQKTPFAVFSQTEDIFGPGHCSFTTTPDGRNLIVYHANLESGSGWHGRSVWIQEFTFDETGFPVFGKPHR